EGGGRNPQRPPAGEKPPRRAPGAGGAREAVERAGKVVDQSVTQSTKEFTNPADAGTTCIDAVVEALRFGVCGIGTIVVTAGVKMQTAGERDAILPVRGADRRPVVRHCDDRPRRWGRNLVRNGG